MELKIPANTRIGSRVAVSLNVAPPPGAFTVRIGLPAGVSVDDTRLTEQVDNGIIASFNASDGLLELRVPSKGSGSAVAVEFEVIPTVAGDFAWGAAQVRSGGAQLANESIGRWHVSP